MGNQYTDFLVPASSFVTGVATLMNLSGGFFHYNTSANETEADARALRNDFAMVGQDLRRAMKEFKTPAGQLELELS